jgi:predicted outer membrane repeat protein
VRFLLKSFIAAFIVAAMATPSAAQIYVDAGATGANDGTSWTDAYVSLQSALLAATSGDEIWVAAGTYKPTVGTDRAVNFELYSGVGLYGGFAGTETMLGERDWIANPTILSGNIGAPDSTDNSYNVFYAIASSPGTVVDGFTITGGLASGTATNEEQGGGMLLINSNITIANMTIERNAVKWRGGGIYIEGGSPTISDVTVRHNFSGYRDGSTTYSGYAAGICAFNCDITMERVVITGNDCNANNSTSDGMYANTSTGTIIDSQFHANNGIGLYAANGPLKLQRVDFTSHPQWALVSDGGVGTGLRLEECTFSDNTGSAMSASEDTLVNCLFVNNSGTSGAGLYTYENSPVLTDVTFVNNTAISNGGAVYCSRSNIEMNNVRFIGNTAGSGGAVYFHTTIFVTPPWYGPRMTNVLFDGNHATFRGGAIYSAAGIPVITNVTLVNNSCDGDGAVVYNYSGTGTFSNSIFWNNSEPLFYEQQSSFYTIDHSLVQGSGGSGVGWDALIGIDGGNNIDSDPYFVDLGGDYRLSQWSPCINKGDNAAPLLPPTDIDDNPRIIDGTVDMGVYEFACATGPIVYVDADAIGANNGSSWADACTTLRAGLGSACGDVTEVWVAEGTYTPTSSGDRKAAFRLINGVGIYGGFAGDEATRDERNPTDHPTVLSGEIGGVTDADNIRHVVVGTNADSTAILDGFIVTEGFASDAPPHDKGAGMFNNPGSPSVSNVVFRGNLALNGGGGVYNHFFSEPRFTNVVFDNNTSSLAGGGAMYNALADVTLTNVTFGNNVAFNTGAATLNNGGNVTMINVVVWGNTPAANQVFNLSGSPSVSYSLIEGCGGSGGGWNALVGTDGGGNIDADPLFVDAPSGNLRLSAGSPAIDAGDNAAPGLPPTDIDGNPRIVGVAVDMGAYEYNVVTAAGESSPVYDTGLRAPYPNPFNPSVTIAYEIDASGQVDLSIYDVAGRLVATVVDGVQEAGQHKETWTGIDRTGNRVASGVYMVVLRAGGRIDHRKITLLK